MEKFEYEGSKKVMYIEKIGVKTREMLVCTPKSFCFQTNHGVVIDNKGCSKGTC